VQSLRPLETVRLLRLPLSEGDTWQVNVAPVKGWIPAGGPPDGCHVRPYCIFVLGLAPIGRVLGTMPVNPPDEMPDARTILEVLMEIMFRPPPFPARPPPPAGAPPPPPAPAPREPHRPGKVTFVDAGMARVCAVSLRALGIEVTVSAPHPHFQRILAEFSNTLLKGGTAILQQQNLRPSLDSIAGATMEQRRAVFALAARVAALRPWERVSEVQAVRAEWGNTVALPAGLGSVPPGCVWVSVIGLETAQKRMAMMAKGVPASQIPPPVRGLVFYYRRYDAEQHWVVPALANFNRATLAGQVPPGMRKPAVVPNELDAVCAQCGKTPSDGVEISICAGCKYTRYCSPGPEDEGKQSACQKVAWKTHSAFCKEHPTNPPPHPNVPNPSGERFFALAESYLFFENAMKLPLSDLDDMRALGATPENAFDYPQIMTQRCGAGGPPTLTELLWICRGMAALIAMMRNAPDAVAIPMPMPAAVTVDLSETDAAVGAAGVRRIRAGGAQSGSGAVASAGRSAGRWWEAWEDEPTAQMRTDPMLTREQHEEVRKKVAAEVASMTETLGRAFADAGT
jgi:hypothetical protein